MRIILARRCSPVNQGELAAALMGRLEARRRSDGAAKAATYLENEGRPDNVVHPEDHNGQRKFITSICVEIGSVKHNYCLGGRD